MNRFLYSKRRKTQARYTRNQFHHLNVIYKTLGRGQVTAAEGNKYPLSHCGDQTLSRRISSSALSLSVMPSHCHDKQPSSRSITVMATEKAPHLLGTAPTLDGSLEPSTSDDYIQQTDGSRPYSGGFSWQYLECKPFSKYIVLVYYKTTLLSLFHIRTYSHTHTPITLTGDPADILETIQNSFCSWCFWRHWVSSGWVLCRRHFACHPRPPYVTSLATATSGWRY